MDKKRRFRIILLSLLFPVCSIIWLGYSLLRNGFDLSRKPLLEHNSLFSKEMQDKLQQPYVYKSKIQPVQSNYNLDQNFHLTVYRVDFAKDEPLSQILKLQGNPTRSYEPYSSYSNDSYLKMTKTADKIDTISIINLKYKGEPIKTIIKNDSVACFYLKFNVFSLSYDKNSDNDVWGESLQSGKSVPINLAFIKRKKAVYIIMLFKNKDENEDFRPELLYSMIKK